MNATAQRLIRDHGPLLLQRELPVPASTLCRAAAAGELTAVLPNTYLPTPLTTELRWRVAAVGGWNPDAVVFGPAAAALSFWSDLPVPAIDVAARTMIRRQGYRFWRRRIPAQFVRLDHGTLQTVPALTAVDMIPSHGGDVIDRVLRARQARLPDLWLALAATSFRHGNVDRRRLLLDSRAEPWSEGERLAHRLLRAAGIGGWRANHGVRLDGIFRYIDIAFVGIRLAVEIDSFRYHSSPADVDNDRIRQNQLVRAGWTVLRFTYRMLLDDPRGVVEQIRAMMRRCAV